MEQVEEEGLNGETKHELADDCEHTWHLGVKTQSGPASIEEIEESIEDEAINECENDAFFL